MSSSLPVELLRLILDNFACPPISNDSTLENPHRHELLSLCLTSKIFRQIAQPLFFASMIFEGDKGMNRLEQLLGIEKDLQGISNVRLLSLKGGRTKGSIKIPTELLHNLSMTCSSLERMVCTAYTIDLNAVSGSNLRKLFVNDGSLEEHDGSFCLPSLVTLSLVNVRLPEPGLKNINFPSLRHLAYEDCHGVLAPDAAKTIVSLSDQLDSIDLASDLFSSLLEYTPAFSTHSVVIDYFDDSPEDFSAGADHVTHARFRVDMTPRSSVKLIKGVETFREVVEDSSRCRQLKSLYLSPLESSVAWTPSGSVREAVKRLVLACGRRGIEVVFERQATGKVRAENQLSEEFMRRMTKERVERESLSGK